LKREGQSILDQGIEQLPRKDCEDHGDYGEAVAERERR